MGTKFGWLAILLAIALILASCNTTNSNNGATSSGILYVATQGNASVSAFERISNSPAALRCAVNVFSHSKFLSEAVLKNPERILQVAKQIGYTPNLAARALSVARASARIGVCMPREIHFFYDQLWRGVLDEARRVEQLGIQFINRPVNTLGEGDTEVFRELLRSGVDGIILTAGNPSALTPLIDEAEAKGIRVVCVSTDAPSSRRSSIVCVEPSLNGGLAGELMGKLLPPGSKVAVVAGNNQITDTGIKDLVWLGGDDNNAINNYGVGSFTNFLAQEQPFTENLTVVSSHEPPA